MEIVSVIFRIAILMAEVLFESYCCVMGRTQLTAKRNGYFTFQTIINKTGAHDAISSF